MSTPETTSYDLGWNDGYAEGYGCKLVDVGQPWMPTGTAAEVEAMADYLMRKHALVFTIRSEAIGIARGMVRAARAWGRREHRVSSGSAGPERFRCQWPQKPVNRART